MLTKAISSTQAQNNFGRLLDEVSHHRTQYVVKRRGTPVAMIISLDEFRRLLSDEGQRERLSRVINELQPEYQLGEVITYRSGVEEGKNGS